MVPLVAASVIWGIAAGQDIATLRRIGLRIIVYFLLTTTVAVSIGSLLAYREVDMVSRASGTFCWG